MFQARATGTHVGGCRRVVLVDDPLLPQTCMNGFHVGWVRTIIEFTGADLVAEKMLRDEFEVVIGVFCSREMEMAKKTRLESAPLISP